VTTTLWVAPRIGYLLTAVLAGGRYDEAAAMWRELEEPAQCDVITALGAQARLAVREAGIPLQVDFTGLADASCTEALGAAQAAYEAMPVSYVLAFLRQATQDH
jgi:predicted transcriptional regulator